MEPSQMAIAVSDLRNRLDVVRDDFNNCNEDNLKSYMHRANKAAVELNSLRNAALTDIYCLEKDLSSDAQKLTENSSGVLRGPSWTNLTRANSLPNSSISKLLEEIPAEVLAKLETLSVDRYLENYLSIVARFKVHCFKKDGTCGDEELSAYWRDNQDNFGGLVEFLTKMGPRSIRFLNEPLCHAASFVQFNSGCCVVVEAKLVETLDAIVGFTRRDSLVAGSETAEVGGKNDKANLERKLIDLIFLYLHFLENSRRDIGNHLIEKLIAPFHRRFRYHFCGDKKTNAVNKPEWMFAQALLWIRDYRELIIDQIQPVFDKFVHEQTESNSSFFVFDRWVRKLLRLVNSRIEHDLEVIRDDLAIFSHLIDETVIFEAGLRGLISVTEESSCLDFLISNQDNLDLWLQLEHVSNTERVNQLLCSKSAFLGRYQEASDIDEFKVPECVDEFLILLQLITERYKFLHDTVAKQRFLSLQLALLDDFRVRLIQIGRDLDTVWCVRYCQVLNSLVYITYVLREWNDLPFFVHLGAVKGAAKRSSRSRRSGSVADGNVETFVGSVGSTGVFDGLIELFDHLLNQMLYTLVDEVLIPQLKNDLTGYKKEKWYAIIEIPTKITYSFCHFLLTLRDRLTFLAANLNASILRKCVCSLASSLNRFFMTELIIGIHFREFGGLQLRYDLDQGMLPLLTSFDEGGSARNVVKSAFRELNDSVSVLSLPVGSAMLLKETVSNLANDGGRAVMREFDLADINMDVLKVLLSQRIDIPTL